jgi:hypothetical protein
MSRPFFAAALSSYHREKNDRREHTERAEPHRDASRR